MIALFMYNICNQADEELFRKQCQALENRIPGLQAEELLEDVDGTKIQRYRHHKGTVKVKNDVQVDAVYVESDFELLAYFAKN